MQKLFKWSAKRAGSHITLTGESTGGVPMKFTGIVKIESGAPYRSPYPVAVDRDGARIHLA